MCHSHLPPFHLQFRNKTELLIIKSPWHYHDIFFIILSLVSKPDSRQVIPVFYLLIFLVILKLDWIFCLTFRSKLINISVQFSVSLLLTNQSNCYNYLTYSFYIKIGAVSATVLSYIFILSTNIYKSSNEHISYPHLLKNSFLNNPPQIKMY